MNKEKLRIKTNLAQVEINKKPCAKKRYETKDEAKQAVNHYVQKYNKMQRLYHCERCGGFHLTTKTREEQRTIESRHDRRIEKVADYWAKKLQIKD